MTNIIEKAKSRAFSKACNEIQSCRLTNAEVEYLGENARNEFVLVTFDCHMRNRWSGQVNVSKVTYVFIQSIENKRSYKTKRLFDNDIQKLRDCFSK